MSTVLEASLDGGQRALLVEPDDQTRRTLQMLLQGWKFVVRSFSAAMPALADGYADSAHVLLVAQRFPDADGQTVLLWMRQRGWRGRAIMVADLQTAELVGDARESGFAAVLGKPVGRLDLLEALLRTDGSR